MKKTPVFTITSLLLNIVSVYSTWKGNTGIAIITAIVAFPLVAIEVPRFSSYFQFTVLCLTGIILGQSLEFGKDHFPFLTISLFLFAFSCLIRVMFFKQVTHTRYLWIDPLAYFLALSLYVFANLFYPQGWVQWVAPFIAILLPGLLISGYVKEGRFYLQQSKLLKGIQVGAIAPDFDLPDQDGNPAKLSDYRNKRSVLLIFVRGDWCPACHMMLRSYERSREKFQEKNVMLLSIGPDPVGVNKEMAMKLGLDFKILADDKQNTAKMYSAHLEEDPLKGAFRGTYEEGSPLPASFLIGIDGRIHYKSKADNVGEFLDPSLIFSVLERLPA